jgi:DNA-binding transcriptional LysR family regulator
VEESLRSGSLAAVLTEYTTLTFPITASYPHREAMPLKVRLFVEMLAKHLRALPGFRDAPPHAKAEPVLLSA